MTKREDRRDLAAKGRHRDQVFWFGVIVAGATIAAAIIQVAFGANDVSVAIR